MHQFATNEYLYSGRNLGDAISNAEHHSNSGVRQTNPEHLYALVYTGGNGSHGPAEWAPLENVGGINSSSQAPISKRYWHWYTEADSHGHASAWFDETATCGKLGKYTLRLTYWIDAVVNRSNMTGEQETVVMERDYLRIWNGKTWNWEYVHSPDKTIADETEGSGYVRIKPSDAQHDAKHAGWGRASVTGLPTPGDLNAWFDSPVP